MRVRVRGRVRVRARARAKDRARARARARGRVWARVSIELRRAASVLAEAAGAEAARDEQVLRGKGDDHDAEPP